jgi:hypothetical protein
VTHHDGSRDLWNNKRAGHRGIEPLGSRQDMPHPRRSGERNWFKTLFVLALLGGAGYAAWKYGRPLLARFRSSADVEQCAGKVLNHLPGKVKTEEELRDAVAREVQDTLTTHYAFKARWYVCFGPSGEGIRVARDDAFAAGEKAFAERLIDASRKRHDAQGVHENVFSYPLGAGYATVTVGDEPWCVVVGWSEKK